MINTLICFFAISSTTLGNPFPQDATTPTTPSTGQCSQVLVRKEWRELEDSEKQDFIDGINALKNTTSTGGTANRYDDFVQIHQDFFFRDAHNNAMFFPWHRQFLKNLETAIQDAINKPTFALPYWQWTIDSQAPDRSPLLLDDPLALGSNGNSRTGCVDTGAFAGMQTSVFAGKQTSGLQTKCLQRWFNGINSTITAFHSPAEINAIVTQATSFWQLSSNIEPAPHGAPHVGIGADMASLESPNDPLFFLHHAMIDRIWAEWQKLHANFTTAYDGPRHSGGGPSQVTDKMQPFDVTVESTLDIRGATQCFEYSAGVVPTAAAGSDQSGNNLSPLTKRQEGTTITESSDQDLPQPGDRTEKKLLRKVQPLPEEFLSSHRMDSQRVRQNEAKLDDITLKVNKFIAAGEYESPASLAVVEASNGSVKKVNTFDDVTQGLNANDLDV